MAEKLDDLPADWINGWEVRGREDGSFGVYDDHGMVAGPYGKRSEAMAEALKLPSQCSVRADRGPERLAK